MGTISISVAFFLGALSVALVILTIWLIRKLTKPKSNLVCIYCLGGLAFYMERDVYDWAANFPQDQWMHLRGRMITWYQEHPKATACLVYPDRPNDSKFAASLHFLELGIEEE